MPDHRLLQIIPFVHPTLAWTALGLGLIPLAIHFLHRRRFRRVPWAAMSFLLAANRRSARRMQFEQFLLMAIRVAIIVLAGWAMARPYLPAGGLKGLANTGVHRVLLIDDTLSMQASRGFGGGSATRWEAALAAAQRLLASFPAGDGVTVVTLTGAHQPLIARPSHDRRFVRDQIAALRATQQPGDTIGALEAAKRILTDSEAAPGNRAAYLISDFPASLWQPDSPGQPSAAGRKALELAVALSPTQENLHFVRIDPGREDNAGVTRIAAETPLVGAGTPTRFFVEVTNHSPQTQRELTVQVRREAAIVRRQTLPTLGPGETVRIPITVAFAQAGIQTIEARIISAVDDALPIDDASVLSVEVLDNVPVLVVDGRPGPSLLDGAAGFLVHALAPRVEEWGSAAGSGSGTSGGARAPRATIGFEPKVISEPELTGEALPRYDTLVLCNVALLSAEGWSRVEEFVRDGGGLLVCMGDLLARENYNRFGWKEGSGVLPVALGPRVAVGESEGESLGFTLGPTPDPLFAEFAATPRSGLFLARVEQYVAIPVVGSHAEVLLRYTNEQPALVHHRFGTGQSAVWTTSADMSWNNLPGKGDFVPLMVQTVASVARSRGTHRNLRVGQVAQEPLDAGESSLPFRVVDAHGQTVLAEVVPDGEGLAVRCGPIEAAGVLTLSVGASSRPFAFHVDPAESDLQTLGAAQLEAAVAADPVEGERGAPNLPLAGGRREPRIRVVSEEALEAAAPPQSAEFSSGLLAAVLGLLAAELGLACWFSAPHPPSGGGRRGTRDAGPGGEG